MKYVIFSVLFLFSGASQAFDVSGTGVVWRAVDGDTFWISDIEPGTYGLLWSHSRNPDHFNQKHSSIKMRIGGVDRAESNHKDKRKNTAQGRAISDHMKPISAGQAAQFRCWTIGDHGRPICAIELQNIGDIGLYLIKKGLSPYVTYWGRHPYLDDIYRRAAAR